jgi:hypothetical protein
MSYEKIHACLNGCVLFRKDHEKATHCPKCKASRYIEVDSGEGRPKTQLTTPESVLWYLPSIQRIQQMYMTEESAKQMTRHKTGRQYSDNLTHPSDAEAWTKFDEKHADKAGKARDVRVALATDGFNPYGMLAAPYTCWPVFVTLLNLPPNIVFQRQYVFVSLIIPGYSEIICVCTWSLLLMICSRLGMKGW